ncbi:MAG: methionine/alanine import family NSS transporter small subunit [Moraxella sp.]|nr:methionine/alanine import family NSS transporter small subunit [Moraxella sp.]
MGSLAMTVMIFAMLLIWGGLVLSIIHLMKNPDIPMDSVPKENL